MYFLIIGIDKPGFVSIFLLSRGARPGEQIVHPRELSNALAAFDRLSAQLAQDLMASWKLDPSYILKLERKTPSLHDLYAELLDKIGKCIQEAHPAAVLVHGDTTSAQIAHPACPCNRSPPPGNRNPHPGSC